MSPRFALASATIALSITLCAPAAFACINGMHQDKVAPPAPEHISSAPGELMASGYFREAAREILGKWGELAGRHIPDMHANDPHDDRRFHAAMLAAAVIRLDGHIELSSADALMTSDSKVISGNMAWALQVLKEAQARYPEDPEIESWLGEAYARHKATRAESVQLLGDLAAREELADGYSWRALAIAQARAGKKKAAAATLKRCEDFAHAPDICTLKPLREKTLSPEDAARSKKARAQASERRAKVRAHIESSALLKHLGEEDAQKATSP